MQAFNLSFNELVPCAAGRRVWTLHEKATKKISKVGKIVSLLDKAFTILALTNYWDRWLNKGSAKWTDSRAGNYQYMGWTRMKHTQSAMPYASCAFANSAKVMSIREKRNCTWTDRAGCWQEEVHRQEERVY
jgi:hypothetical protein